MTPGKQQQIISKWSARQMRYPLCALRAVLHVGVGAIASARGLDVPLAVLVLVFDDLGKARHALLLGRGPGGRQRVRVGGEGLREYAAGLVGPAAVVLDDLIRHVRHCCTFAVRDPAPRARSYRKARAVGQIGERKSLAQESGERPRSEEHTS